MNKLESMGLRFLKKSKKLTLSCLLSIFITTVVLILAYNFYTISAKNYKQNIKEMYGNADYMFSVEENETLSAKKIEEIKTIDGVEAIATGRFGHATIKGNYVYLLGLQDCKMNHYRYQYSSVIQEDKIIVNEKMAEKQNLRVGDTVKLGDAELIVSEIIYEDNFTNSNLLMAIVSEQQMATYLNQEKSDNFCMVKKKAKLEEDTVYEELQKLFPKLDILSVEGDEEFQKSIQAYAVFLIVVVLLVTYIGALLIASVFQSFLKKYMMDMRILKTIGGNQKQIRCIFMTAALTLDGIGCLAGLIVGLSGGKLLFYSMSGYLSISKSAVEMDVVKSVLISVSIFVILAFFLSLKVQKFAKNLPLHVMEPSRKKVRKKKSRFFHSKLQKLAKHLLFPVPGISRKKMRPKKPLLQRALQRLVSADGMVSLRLLFPKLKENVLIIVTIACLTMFSYFFINMLEQISSNNMNYYNSIYLSELLIENGSYQEMKWDSIQNILETLDNTETTSYAITGIEDTQKSYFEGAESFIANVSVCNFKKLKKANVITKEKQDYEHCVMLSSTMAKQLDLQEGDTHTFTYIIEGKKKQTELEIVRILSTNFYGDIILDEQNSFYPTASMDYYYPTFFATDYNSQIEQTLMTLQHNNPNLMWQSYSEAQETSDRIMTERFLMVRTVLAILLIIIGIGWFNAAKNMISDRAAEYCTLRKLGMTEKRVQMIIWRQIGIFMITGILLGAALGYGLFQLLSCLASDIVTTDLDFSSIGYIIVFMVFLAATLHKTIKYHATCKIV